MSNEQLTVKKGDQVQSVVIAFMGLPGSGKTTIASAVANQIDGSRIFCEPEECDWPLAVTGRHKYGYFTAITCFRAMRVPQLFIADEIRIGGGVAIVDSYYDKLISRYVANELMSWLIPSSDPYFDVMASVAELDWEHLPDADHLIFLNVHEEQWKGLLRSRNRNLDQEQGLLDSFSTQEAFLDAARQVAAERPTELHIITQITGRPEDVAKAVLDAIDVNTNGRDSDE